MGKDVGIRAAEPSEFQQLVRLWQAGWGDGHYGQHGWRYDKELSEVTAT